MAISKHLYLYLPSASLAKVAFQQKNRGAIIPISTAKNAYNFLFVSPKLGLSSF